MMATPPSGIGIGKITTQEIGKLLDKEYPDDGTDSIDYFYVQLRKQYVSKAKQLSKHDPTAEIERFSQPAAVTGIESIKKVITGRKWPSIYLVKFPRRPQQPPETRPENLREQEKRLDTNFRRPLKDAIDKKLCDIRQTLEQNGQQFSSDKLPVQHIIITRVCKYTHHQGIIEDGTDSDSDNEMQTS